jgi:glutamate-1-semialdehyde 2,1-aminomutase
MRLGGLDQTEYPRVFLLSTTHGAETHALAAAIATMKIYQNEPVIEHLHRQGRRLAKGLNEVIRHRQLDAHFQIAGRDSCLFYAALDQRGRPSQEFRTLFLQETIRRGVLAPSLVVSYSHGDNDIDQTIEAIDGALGVYAMAIEDGISKYLVGRPSKIVYRQFNDSPAKSARRDPGLMTQKAS